MTQNEIKTRIDANNREIEELIQPFKFTLNNRIAELMSENEKLQAQCKHEYKNCECIWCYKRGN